MSSKRTTTGLISTRAALILALSLIVAIGAATLTYLSEPSAPAAALAASGAWAAAVVFFNAIVDRD